VTTSSNASFGLDFVEHKKPGPIEKGLVLIIATFEKKIIWYFFKFKNVHMLLGEIGSQDRHESHN
jgi:hypothetical protein